MKLDWLDINPWIKYPDCTQMQIESIEAGNRDLIPGGK